MEQIISLIFMMRQLSFGDMANKEDKDFSFLHFAILRYIKEKKPLMKEVADFLAITPPSATSLIKTLTEEKLVSRLAEKEDRRIVRIVITRHGENKLKKWQKEIAKKMQKRLEKLNKSEQASLVRILTKVSTL